MLTGDFPSPDGSDTFTFEIGPISPAQVAPFSCGVKLFSKIKNDDLVSHQVYGENAFQALQLAIELIASLSGWEEAFSQR